MTDPRIRTLVIDDSALMRSVIPAMLARAPDIEVVGVAPDPLVARQMIKDLDPDVITLDVEMPRMDGLAFLEKIMTLRPTPVVMVSSLTRDGAEATLNALELGAIDFFEKPMFDLRQTMEERSAELIDKIRSAAKVQVRRKTVAARRLTGAGPGFAASEMLIAIGASTGGVELLNRLLSALPADAPGVVVAQHMPPNFTRNFAARLARACIMKVAEAEHGQRIMPGQVVIAPGGLHLTVQRSGADLVCALSDAPPVNRFRPSVDVLFSSVAENCGARAVGVILTGMGRDGAAGLLAMRRAGAATLGQDEATSLVYGMPRAAMECGAVERQVADTGLPAAIMDIARERARAWRI